MQTQISFGLYHICWRQLKPILHMYNSHPDWERASVYIGRSVSWLIDWWTWWVFFFIIHTTYCHPLTSQVYASVESQNCTFSIKTIKTIHYTHGILATGYGNEESVKYCNWDAWRCCFKWFFFYYYSDFVTVDLICFRLTSFAIR